MKQNKNWLKNLPENIKINIGYEPKSKKYKYYLYKLDFRKKTDKNLTKTSNTTAGRAFPRCTLSYTVGPQTYIETSKLSSPPFPCFGMGINFSFLPESEL